MHARNFYFPSPSCPHAYRPGNNMDTVCWGGRRRIQRKEREHETLLRALPFPQTLCRFQGDLHSHHPAISFARWRRSCHTCCRLRDIPRGLQRLPWPWGRLLGPPCKIPMTPLTSGIKAAASELDPVIWLNSTLYWPMTRLDISIKSGTCS